MVYELTINKIMRKHLNNPYYNKTAVCLSICLSVTYTITIVYPRHQKYGKL